MEQNGINKLRELAKTSTSTYQDIAKYIVNNAEKVQDMRITELAEAMFTSTATIVRMCKKLGYKGYSEFKRDLRINLHKWFFEEQEIYNRGYIYPDKAALEITEVITNLTVNGIIKSSQMLDPQLILALVNSFLGAERIDFYGCGISNIVAQDFAYRFLRSGKNTSAHLDTHMQYSQVQLSYPNCVAVGISYSGATAEVIDMLKIAKQLGAITISFTSEKENELANIADYNLFVAEIENPEGYVAATSRIEMMHLMDIIYSVYASLYKDVVVPKISLTRPYFKKK